MPKSKHTRKNKRRDRPGLPPKKRDLAGLQLRSLEIKDEIDETYQAGIPDDIAAATIMLQEGRVEAAKAAFERIIEREPRAREAYLNLAVAYAHLGDETTAEALTRQALDRFPHYAMPRINLARMHFHRGQVEAAKEMLLPLDNASKFTSIEFQTYARTWSDICAAEGNPEAAQSWLRMLSEVNTQMSGQRPPKRLL
jgi:Flp pilus assembly protein TadD